MLFSTLPASAKTWRGDMLANASWNEETRLEDIRHYPRPTDVFRQQGPYWRPDADMFDHTDLKHAPRPDLFPKRYGEKPASKLFYDKF